MRITETTSYDKLLYLMTRGVDFRRAVRNLEIISGPDYNSEGFAGYIEVKFAVEVENLEVFTRIWLDWHTLSEAYRNAFYALAKGKLE